jgi:hypothetical protein
VGKFSPRLQSSRKSSQPPPDISQSIIESKSPLLRTIHVQKPEKQVCFSFPRRDLPHSLHSLSASSFLKYSRKLSQKTTTQLMDPKTSSQQKQNFSVTSLLQTKTYFVPSNPEAKNPCSSKRQKEMKTAFERWSLQLNSSIDRCFASIFLPFSVRCKANFEKCLSAFF